jgi:SAM-dependent methyltransferase
MADLQGNKLAEGRGWDNAYRVQAATSSNPDGPDYLWKEGPIEFLNDAELDTLMRREHVGHILDAGAGDGRNSFALESRGYFVVGVDQSPTAVKLAAQRAIRGNRNRVVFAQDDVTDLRQGGPFDFVLCADTLGQIDEPALAIANFRRVLKPGGWLLFNVYTEQDGTYGVGRRIDRWNFEYKETLFKYFDEQMVKDLVVGMENVRIQVATWLDPPHGDFRPEPHVHNSFVVLAQNPREEA